MIQRIQSVFLALAAMASAFMLIPISSLPLMKFYSESNTLHFHSLYIKSLVPGELSPFSDYYTWPLAAILLLIFLFASISIFLYKNRRKQMLWIKINVVLSFILLVGFFFGYVTMLEKELNTDAIYSFTSFMPALILVLLIFAYRGVKKDDKLIKSMDRIR